MKYFTVFFSATMLIFIISQKIDAQDIPGIEEEAPATIWDFSIGDAEVDLYLAGYWKIGIMGGLSFESTREGTLFPATYPGFTDFKFYQEPDLTISLWLLNRFYLETSFLEGFDKNTYAMGYRGMDDEVIQSVRIGNSDIKIKDYKGITVPSPKYNTPGISASFQTASTFHDVLVRYDPTSEHKKIFLGEYEISEELIGTGTFKKGQYFILPDTDWDFIEVYIADKLGIYTGDDGKKYRKATNDEMYYSLSDGTLSLNTPSEQEVLVYYEKGINSVGDVVSSSFVAPLVNGEPDPAGTLLDFSWADTDTWYPLPILGTYDSSRKTIVNGRSALKVYDPGKIGPFEFFNVYEVSSRLPLESWKSETYLVDNSQIKAGDSEQYEYRVSNDENTLSLFNNTDTAIRSVWSRYPLADNYPQNYGSEEIDKDIVGRSLLLSIKKDNLLNLGPGVVPGSEQIYINGYRTSSATVNYKSGKISFPQYIFPHDRIVVNYRTETTDLAGGDLLVAQGNRFHVSDNFQFYLAEMFRWNIAKKSSTTVDRTSAGGLTIAGGFDFEQENVKLQLISSLAIDTKDTTGYLRLRGMEEKGFQFSIGKDLVKYSPQDISYNPPLTSLSSLNKIDLIYRDYFSTNALGQFFLNSYNWTGASVNSSKKGPSIASKSSSDSFDSNVMLMEYDLSAASDWSAGDLLLDKQGPIDLSRYNSIILNMKKLQSFGAGIISITLLIGETGEAEDWNDDGFKSNEDISMIVPVSVPGTYYNTDDQWKSFRYYFTDTEKKKLAKSRAIRVLIECDAAIKGKLLLSAFIMEGSLFDASLFNSVDAEIVADDKLIVTEISDSIAQSLTSSYPEIIERFHPQGETQQSLRIEWGNPTNILITDYWTVESHTAPVPADNYKNFTFYVYNDSNSMAGNYDINLTDSNNKGYHFNYSPSSTGWKSISLSLETGNVTDSSGSILTTALIDSNPGELTLFMVKSNGTTDGVMYFDELHYSESTFSINGSVEFTSEYTYEGDILSIESFPIFSNFHIANSFSFQGGKVLSEISQGNSSLQNKSSLSFDFVMISIGANLSVDWKPETSKLSAGHTIQFPSEFTYGYINDSYSRSGYGDEASMERGNTIHFKIPDIGYLDISTKANASDLIVTQNWSGKTSWFLTPFINLGSSTSLKQNSLWIAIEKNNYFANWINNFTFFIPTKSTVNSRIADGNLFFKIDSEPIGLEFKPFLSFETNHKLPTSTQKNKGGFTFSLPFTFKTKNNSKWSMTFSYSREFIEKSEKLVNNSFEDGFTNMFNDLSIWMPLTTFIPFYEFFNPYSPAKFKSKALSFDDMTYSPQLGIQFKRTFASKLYDLFLPYHLNLQFSRNFVKKNDSLSNNNQINLTLKQSAINLLGNFGSFPLFTFYNSDEISSSINFNVKIIENILIADYLIIQHFFSLFTLKKRDMTIENRLEFNFDYTYFTDSINFIYKWQNGLLEKFAINFLNEIIDKPHYWSHEELLSLKIEHPWQVNEKIQETSFQINLKHQSKLNIPALGAMRAWLKLGFFKEVELIRAGFEAGLELEVSF